MTVRLATVISVTNIILWRLLSKKNVVMFSNFALKILDEAVLRRSHVRR